MFSDTLTAKDTRGSGRDLVIALHASNVSARVFPPLRVIQRQIVRHYPKFVGRR